MNARHELQRALLVLAVGAFGLILNSNTSAQVQTQTYTATGQPTTEVKVERGTVVLVDGNDLVVKAEDGHLVHFANVPESAHATVDGQELGIHDLKPGMTLERTIKTTTTPQTITTVKHVTGTVWSVNPPSSVILTLADGTHQAFKIPDGQKFNIDGQMADAWGLRKGMKISATKVTEVPDTVVEENREVSGTTPPPDPPRGRLPVATSGPGSAAAACGPVRRRRRSGSQKARSRNRLCICGEYEAGRSFRLPRWHSAP